MEKTDWVEMRKKVKSAIDQGLKVLKEGTEEAKYIATQTAHLLQLEMDIHALKSKLVSLTERLGKEVHRAMTNGKVNVTTEIRKLNGEMSQLEGILKRKGAELQRLSIVRKKTAKKARKSVAR